MPAAIAAMQLLRRGTMPTTARAAAMTAVEWLGSQSFNSWLASNLVLSCCSRLLLTSDMDYYYCETRSLLLLLSELLYCSCRRWFWLESPLVVTTAGDNNNNTSELLRAGQRRALAGG